MGPAHRQPEQFPRPRLHQDGQHPQRQRRGAPGAVRAHAERSALPAAHGHVVLGGQRPDGHGLRGNQRLAVRAGQLGIRHDRLLQQPDALLLRPGRFAEPVVPELGVQLRHDPLRYGAAFRRPLQPVRPRAAGRVRVGLGRRRRARNGGHRHEQHLRRAVRLHQQSLAAGHG